MRLHFSNISGSIFVYMDVMRALCGDTAGKSMIDLGCCFAPNTPELGFNKRTYIDIIDRKLEQPGEQKFFYQKDILEVNPYDDGIHDVAIATDVIEHLLFEDGVKFVDIMRQVSSKQIIFTPTTALFGIAEVGNKDPEAHRSLWDPDWFGERGWFTIVFHHFHPTWNSGAFFAWRDDNSPKDFTRVYDELKTKEWSNLI